MSRSPAQKTISVLAAVMVLMLGVVAVQVRAEAPPMAVQRLSVEQMENLIGSWPYEECDNDHCCGQIWYRCGLIYQPELPVCGGWVQVPDSIKCPKREEETNVECEWGDDILCCEYYWGNPPPDYGWKYYAPPDYYRCYCNFGDPTPMLLPECTEK